MNNSSLLNSVTKVSDLNNLSNANGTNFNAGRNSNDELLQKLNYLVYLLEEQRAQKSNYVTEEIILYIFLGIFIIFVLDKFSSPKKYIR